ncbi:Aminopeptidase YwaD [Planctomycetales bacterium 10988]|nr:Aminopeptidase YwaD [Planctomycetales bacterium 10988]
MNRFLDGRRFSNRFRLLALVSFLLLAAVDFLLAQVPPPEVTPLLEPATPSQTSLQRITEDVRYLASDELEGRGVQTEGIHKAAVYIREVFREAGLKSGTEDGSYFQSFPVVVDQKVLPAETSLVLEGPDGQRQALELEKDFQPLMIGGAGKMSAPLVFAGYGIEADSLGYNDYKSLDVKGKVVLILRREPQQAQQDSVFAGEEITPHSYIRTKLQAAKKQGAVGVLLVNDTLFTTKDEPDELVSANGFGTRSMQIPFAQLSQAAVNGLLKQNPITGKKRELKSVQAIEKQIDRSLKPLSMPLEGWTVHYQTGFEKVKISVPNVVGILPGEGPYAKEAIILGAHYDHLGFGEIGSRIPNSKELHVGADDNASGTAAILELARRFGKQEQKPKRTLIFMAFTAEERGLLGSQHYIKNPLYPLNQTIAMLNFDMIGRLRKSELTVYGGKTGDAFEKALQRANAEEELTLNQPSGMMGASDHYPFYQQEIPVLHFFTGITKEYHTPADRIETLNLPGIVQVVDYSEAVLDYLLHQTEPPQFAQVSSASRGRGNMAYLGVMPNYEGEADGLELNGVSPNSPADQGGLKKGDIIVQFGEIPVGDIQGLAAGLRKYKPGETIKVTVKRGKATEELQVTLGEPLSDE